MANQTAATSAWKIVHTHVLRGQIEVVTGLRVDGSQDTMEISGLDNPILRNPANEEPYLPGSSLKGKMRMLAEWYYGQLPDRGDPTRPKPDSTTARVFGVPAKEGSETGPTRLIVRDAPLAESSRRAFKEGRTPLTEIKTENSINRLTAMANPRPMERVVPGVRFDFELVYRVLDTGDGGAADRANYEIVKTALALLEADYLGSAGTRGCGQVRFVDLKDEAGAEVRLPRLDSTAQAPVR